MQRRNTYLFISIVGLVSAVGCGSSLLGPNSTSLVNNGSSSPSGGTSGTGTGTPAGSGTSASCAPTAQSWTQINAPGISFGAGVYPSAVFTMLSSNNYYVNTYWDGLYVTSDRGKTWTQKLPANSVGQGVPEIPRGLVRDPSDPNTIYSYDFQGKVLAPHDDFASLKVIAGPLPNPNPPEQDPNLAFGIEPQLVKTDGSILGTSTNFNGGIYRSADEGVTWAEVYTDPIAVNSYAAIVADPNDANHLLSGSGNTVLASNDGGNTWGAILQAGGNLQGVNGAAFAPNSMVYLATLNGMLISHDNGRSFDPNVVTFGTITDDLNNTYTFNTVDAVAVVTQGNEQAVYAVVETYYGFSTSKIAKVVASTDQGATWKDVSPIKMTQPVTSQFGTCSASLQVDSSNVVYLSLGFCGGVYVLE